MAAVALLGMTGCFLGGDKGCNKTYEYQVSKSVPPLEVPTDLDEPNRAGGLVIPVEGEGAGSAPQDQPCLDQPPDYFEKEPD